MSLYLLLSMRWPVSTFLKAVSNMITANLLRKVKNIFPELLYILVQKVFVCKTTFIRNWVLEWDGDEIFKLKS